MDAILNFAGGIRFFCLDVLIVVLVGYNFIY